jgi:hypothetical protein
MARGKKDMAEADETQDVDDIEEGKLPPSDLKKLGKGIDLEAMATEELLTLIGPEGPSMRKRTVRAPVSGQISR